MDVWPPNVASHRGKAVVPCVTVIASSGTRCDSTHIVRAAR